MLSLEEPMDVKCPGVGCDRSYACDACMHGHLVRRHGARYADAFGEFHEAWLHFCEAHRGCSPTTLGL